MAEGLNLIQMHHGYKAFGVQVLFDGAVFAVNEGEHVGVIGPNGAGKTTLFRILLNQEELDSGELIRSKQLRIGYLSQHEDWQPGETGNSYLERVCRLPLWQVKSMGRELQLTEAHLDRPVLSLSGGYRMRIKLLALLGQDPNLMLLDEPTNYLDLETTLLLERFLQNFSGAFMLISHDREFLRRTTDHILEVESGEITKYNGNIDDYFEQKALLREQQLAQAKSQAEKRKAVMEFVSRFGAKATKAKQAQSRMRALEKMETIEIKSLPVTAKIKIPEPHHTGRSIIQFRNVDLGYDLRPILTGISVDIRRGDHVAVVGLNGAGKSTLLKGLAGTLKPLAGERELGHQVELAIFNQHVAEALDNEKTVIECLSAAAHPSLDMQDVRDMAGALLFGSDHINKKVSVLSGGEKSRVALGQILLKKVPCLLLDEPTNHLDFQTVEALTESLKRYSGTVIVVSHDRGFIRRVADKILEVNNGKVRLYPGTYDEYVWSLQKSLAEIDAVPVASAQQAVKSVSPTESVAINRKEISRELRLIEKKIQQCETAITKLQAEVASLNDEIAAGQAENLQSQLSRLAEANQKLETIESEWLALMEKREQLIVV